MPRKQIMIKLTAVIKDDNFVHIDGVAYSERDELMKVFKVFLNDHPNGTLFIDAETNEYFRAIGKAVYASQFAGFSKEAVTIHTPEATICGDVAAP